MRAEIPQPRWVASNTWFKGPDGNDSIAVDDNEGVFNTTLDVAGATITVDLEGEVAAGTTFQILDADNIVNVGELTLNLPDGFNADLVSGTIIFGGVIECDSLTMGDIDGDGEVAFADFLTLSANFGNVATDHTTGDIDCSGEVDFADFLTLSANFGQTLGGVQTVPEPSGLCLLMLSAFALGLFRRSR